MLITTSSTVQNRTPRASAASLTDQRPRPAPFLTGRARRRSRYTGGRTSRRPRVGFRQGPRCKDPRNRGSVVVNAAYAALIPTCTGQNPRARSRRPMGQTSASLATSTSPASRSLILHASRSVPRTSESSCEPSAQAGGSLPSWTRYRLWVGSASGSAAGRKRPVRFGAGKAEKQTLLGGPVSTASGP
jgi:hypothetical protein